MSFMNFHGSCFDSGTVAANCSLFLWPDGKVNCTEGQSYPEFPVPLQWPGSIQSNDSAIELFAQVFHERGLKA